MNPILRCITVGAATTSLALLFSPPWWGVLIAFWAGMSLGMIIGTMAKLAEKYDA